jgi:hypothetical protein
MLGVPYGLDGGLVIREDRALDGSGQCLGLEVSTIFGMPLCFIHSEYLSICERHKEV